MTRMLLILGLAPVALLTAIGAPDPGPPPSPAFVTGAGSRLHFSFGGTVTRVGQDHGTGSFRIIVHPDSPDGSVVAVICTYKTFDNVQINGNTATFHSVGSGQVLLSDGTISTFVADNAFAIVDNGAPGAGADAIDVNFLGATGIAVPGGTLAMGNFVVSAP
jgi:hypothetical protein